MGLVLGCGPEEAGEARVDASDGASGVRIVALDSVRLRENDSLYIAHMNSLTVDPLDGSYYIADGYAMRAYRFARSGEPINVYGRPGDGPGEIRDTQLAFAVSDSLVAVDDFRERMLELFDRRTGVFVGRRPHGGASARQVLASVDGDTIWLGFPDYPGGDFAVSMWIPAEDRFRHLWRVPRLYRDHPSYFVLGGLNPSLARWGDAFLLGFGALPHLYVVGLEGPWGEYRDSLRIPVRRRRPIPEDIVEIAETAPLAEQYASLSRLRHIFRRTDGSYLLLHGEPHVEGVWPALEGWSEFYLGILDADLAWACVDAPLELGPRPHVAFSARGDTLFVLQRRVVDGEAGREPSAATWVKRILVRVDVAACDWLETAIPGTRGR